MPPSSPPDPFIHTAALAAVRTAQLSTEPGPIKAKRVQDAAALVALVEGGAGHEALRVASLRALDDALNSSEPEAVKTRRVAEAEDLDFMIVERGGM